MENTPYDPEAESSSGKAPRFKGVESGGRGSDRWRRREILWVKRDGVWRGSWRWSRFEAIQERNERLESERERVIRVWNSTNAPQEVLLLVIKSLVNPPPSYARGIEDEVGDLHGSSAPKVDGLVSLALVCKAWYENLKHALYCRLKITDTFTSRAFRPSTMKNVHRISVQHAWPGTQFPRERDHPCLGSNLS